MPDLCIVMKVSFSVCIVYSCHSSGGGERTGRGAIFTCSRPDASTMGRVSISKPRFSERSQARYFQCYLPSSSLPPSLLVLSTYVSGLEQLCIAPCEVCRTTTVCVCHYVVQALASSMPSVSVAIRCEKSSFKFHERETRETHKTDGAEVLWLAFRRSR